MKKIVLLFLLMGNLTTAQNRIAERIAELQNSNTKFTRISVFTSHLDNTDPAIGNIVNGATLARLNKVKVIKLLSSQDDYLRLEISFQSRNIALLLYKVNLFAENFHIDSDQGKNLPYEKGIYYRGIILGNPNSIVSFNVFKDGCNGIISSSSLGNVVIGKLLNPINNDDYIVYSDANMSILNPFTCGVTDKGFVAPTVDQNIESSHCVTAYFEIDNNLFIANNSDVTATTNWMTSVFNNVQALYDNDGISVSLKSVFIWTTPDPYEGVGASSLDYLDAFEKQTPIFDGDVGQLIGLDAGNLGGVAYVDGLCSKYNISYSDLESLNFGPVPTYSWTIEVITHELGHVLGSPHSHGCYWNGNSTVIDGCGQQVGATEGSCPQGPIPAPEVKGTIMSYCHLIQGVGISFSNGFGSQPRALIISTINGASCLSSDCAITCRNAISSITIDNITSQSVSFSWVDSSTDTWQVAVTPFSSSNIVWNTVTARTYSTSGLQPNAYYNIQIRPLCAGTESAISERTFATLSDDVCNGIPFTDTGGTTANYTNLESWVRTITPTESGLKAKVTFSSFDLEQGNDYLRIYDGSDTSAPDLTNGGLTGNTVPNAYVSTATDGSLTFRFQSDEGITAAGWNAVISCEGSLGTSHDYRDFGYYPNPATNNVMIVSKKEMTQVSVYNIQGRLLYDEKMNSMKTNVDLSQFATGTYFFKLRFDDKEANFKILKM